MSEFPRMTPFPDPQISVSTQSINGINAFGTFYSGTIGTNSGAYPTANMAFFSPFRITQPLTFSTMYVFNGGTVSGNIDVGVYSNDGTRIVSKGGTAQTGGSTIQTFTVTTTELDSGLFYFALSMDNTTGIVYHYAPAQAAFLNFVGVAQMASAYPLPATATFASNTNAYAPAMGLTVRSFV